MSLRFAIVAEAAADHRTAMELADRVLIDAIDWLDDQQLPYQREWLTEFSGELLTWKRMRALASAAGIAAEGFFDGQPGLPDAQAARRALRFLCAKIPNIKAVLLIRDQDDQVERRAGLEQARREDHEGLVIVIGLAIVEREAWVIAGFDPQSRGENERLEVERNKLGFHPLEQSHLLNACKDDTSKRSPKRVLRALTDGDKDRERQCWLDTPLDKLRERGSKNGLAVYLDELKLYLTPILGHVK